jgi:hypothetical protein
MTKTFNRNPLSFDTPNSDNVSNSTFSQWQGINESLNTFSVNQNSFEDCENVYVNEDNVLTSRPTLSSVYSDAIEKEYYKTSSYLVVVTRDVNLKFYVLEIDKNMLLFNEVTNLIYPNIDEKFYITEISNILFVFSDKSIYRITKVGTQFVLQSAIENVYVPYKDDVKNLFMPGAYRIDEDKVANDYNDLVLNSNKYENENLLITITFDEREKTYAWPYPISDLKYNMVNHVSDISDVNDGVFMICNGEPSLIYVESGKILVKSLISNDINEIPGIALADDYIVCDFYKNTGFVYYMCKTSVGDDVVVYKVNPSELKYTSKIYSMLVMQNDLRPLGFVVASNQSTPGMLIEHDDYVTATLVRAVTYIPNLQVDSTGYIYVYRGFASINVEKTRRNLWIRDEFRSIADNSVIYGYTNIVNGRIIGDNQVSNSPDRNQIILPNYRANILARGVDYFEKISGKPTTRVFIQKLLARFDGTLRSYFVNTNVYCTSVFMINLLNMNTIENIGLGTFDKIKDVFYDGTYFWFLTDVGIFTNKSYASSKDIIYNFKYAVNASYEPYLPHIISESNDSLFIVNNVSYLLMKRTEGDNVQLYLPENKDNNFYEKIQNVVPLENNNYLLFSKNSIWYVNESGQDDKLLPLYTYDKSKMKLDIVENSDGTTAYDGATILLPTYQGLAGLSYNQIVSVTEHIVTYLSNDIFNNWLSFAKNAIKFCNYKYYLFVYSEYSNLVWVYDYRYNTWWKWKFDKNVKVMITFDNYCLIGTDFDVYQLDENTLSTDWFIKSQKLHLDAPNYNKQIKKFVIHTIGEQDDEMTMNVQFTNYRKRMFEEDDDTINYNVDFLRTYIKRFNYPKVLYFQYKLSNNKLDSKPLRLTGINIEYVVGGKIR